MQLSPTLHELVVGWQQAPGDALGGSLHPATQSSSASFVAHVQVRAEGQLFPPFCDILQVSTHVAAVLARHMCETGLGIRPEGPVRGPTPQGAQSPNGNGVAADTLSPRRDQQKSPSPQPQEGARKANGSGPDVNKGSQDPELSAWREVVYANMWQGARPHAQRMPRSPSLVQAMQVCKL
jgi:hypothetical protein